MARPPNDRLRPQPRDETDAGDEARTVVSPAPSREQPNVRARREEPRRAEVRRDDGRRNDSRRDARSGERDPKVFDDQTTAAEGMPPSADDAEPAGSPVALPLDRTAPSAAALRRDSEPDVVGAPEHTMVEGPPADSSAPKPAKARRGVTMDHPSTRITQPWEHIGSGFRDIGRGLWGVLRLGLDKVLPASRREALERHLGAFARQVAAATVAAYRLAREGAVALWRYARIGAGQKVARLRGNPTQQHQKIYEDLPPEKADRARAEEFDRFRRGKVSSSYLQDEESTTKPGGKR